MQQSLSNAQERDYARIEKRIIKTLEQEDKLAFPVPSFALIAMVFGFIVIFPTLYILDPYAASDSNINIVSMLNFYFPLAMCIVVWVMNQRFFVPQCVFQKRYVRYFVYNSILVGVTSFFREVLFYLVERSPDQGLTFFFSDYLFSNYKTHFSFWTLVSYFTLVSLICIICLFYQLTGRQLLKGFVTREQKQARLQYELDFLKNQLSPHFLFNTLNNITSLIHVDPKRAETSMTELSKLLRVTLYQTSDEQIPLSEDVEILRMYGNLEKLRLDEDYDFQFQVDVENPDLPVAPLIVMPLMENALKHSMNPNGKSFAHVSIVQKGSEIVFTAENSNHPRKSAKKSSGLGLDTFRKRLELLYAGRYEYTTSAEGGVYRSCLKLRV